MKSRLGLLVLVLALATPVTASAADEITPEDVETAARVRRLAAAEVEAATRAYDDALAELDNLEQKLTSLEISLDVKVREIGEATVEARRIAREHYMAGGSSAVMLVLDSSSVSDIPLRSGYMDLVTANDTAALNHLQALEATYEAQQESLAEAVAAQSELAAEAEALAELILRRLEEAQDDYDGIVSAYQAQEAEKARLAELERLRREEEERRRREAEAAAAAAAAQATTTTTTTSAPSPTTTTSPPAPPVTIDGRVCPVDGPSSFVDTWGAPRSGGRRHQGVDMIAKRNTPLIAIETGKVRRMGNGGLGGITVWLRADNGDEYYYAHLEDWADGLEVGQRLEVGELLGYVGNSGNARYTVTHLHFEYHPGGGSAVNPYPLVKALCG